MRVVVNDRDYDLKELGLDKYEFLQKLDEMKDPQVISFLTDAPIEDIKKAPFGEVKFVSSMVKKQAFDMFEDTPLELTYTHKGKNYGLIVPSKISFEEWINLEVFMAKDKVDLPLMAAHLYKPLKNDKQGHERELIDYSLEECEERAKYPIIFGDETDRQETRNQSLEPGESQQLAIDFYYNSLMLCASDDILKIEPVLRLSLQEVLGYLSYTLFMDNLFYCG